MISRKRLSKTAFLALLLTAVVSCGDEQLELHEIQTTVDSLSVELETQQRRNDSLEQIINSSGANKDIPVYFGREFDTIPNPEVYIATALKPKRDKIPINAVLGGNMEFRQVDILTEDWILAVYDDGHIQGKSIYKYELQPNGDVEFTEIVSKLPNQN